MFESGMKVKIFTMRNCVFAISLCLSSLAYAKEYGNYDPKKILTVSESTSGKKYGIDGRYLDQMLSDLAFHARNYPPRFDSPVDRQRAERDIRALSGMLDVLVNSPNPHPEILLRAGLLNSIGHNLDIPDSGKKTSSIFNKLLSTTPMHPKGNHVYGTFLAGAGKPKEAIPYLERAHSLGVPEAGYSLGMTYLSLGDKQKALGYLENYQRNAPNDTSVGRLIEAIRNGKVEFKKTTN